jgi:hypothetical protein
MATDSVLIPDKPIVANATAVTYPLELEITLKVKLNVPNSETHAYVINRETNKLTTYFLADTFDSLDLDSDIISINGITRPEIQQRLHEEDGAVT